MEYEKNSDFRRRDSTRERELLLQRRTLSPLTVFRGELGLFTNSLLRTFKVRDCSTNSGQQQEERSLDTVLRKDLNNLREDLSDVSKVDHTNDQQHLPGLQSDGTEIMFKEERSKENQTHQEQKIVSSQCSDWWQCGKWSVNNGVLDNEGTSVTLLSSRRVYMKDTQEPSDRNLWNLKNLASYLTLDPNTANSELLLSEGNRTATRVWAEGNVVHHPERFQSCPQALCREGLLDSAYWEVEWSGGADVGVAYNSLSRAGAAQNVLLGQNRLSWSLECYEGSYTPCHDRQRLHSTSPRPFSQRVGVHLDREAGSLSFYCVGRDSMTLLHTFKVNFCEPLYAGFWVWSYGGTVTLRQVELDWERLQ